MLFCLEVLVVLGMFSILVWLIALLYSLYLSVPFVPMPQAAFGRILDTLDIKDGDVVYELGSGDGRMIVAAAAKYPDARFIGIELNPLLCTLARIRARRKGVSRNTRFVRQDLFTTDLTSANKLYMYLLDRRMQKLYPKLLRELKGARVISLAFTFKDKEPLRVIEFSQKRGTHGQNRLYVYDF